MDVAVGNAKRGNILLFFQFVLLPNPLPDFRDVVDHVLPFINSGNAFYPVARVDVGHTGCGERVGIWHTQPF